MLHLERTLRYSSIMHNPNFGYVAMTLSATGNNPSEEPVPGILEEIEAGAQDWVESDLLPLLACHMGPQLLSGDPDRRPVFRSREDDHLTCEVQISRAGCVFTCGITMEFVPKTAIGDNCVEDIRSLIRTRMLSAIEPAGAKL